MEKARNLEAYDKHYTSTETLVKAIELANSYGVQVQCVQKAVSDYYIGRDEESGEVIIFLSDKLSPAIASFYIIGLLLYAQSRQWVDIDDDTTTEFKKVVARIKNRHEQPRNTTTNFDERKEELNDE